jgi:2',3'-cyclic-nucleotide 2'-phosphodiesterase (5'-nucleotidase family)
MNRILEMMKVKILIAGFLLWIPAVTLASSLDQTVTLLLTSNLNGNFTTSEQNQDKEDPMLVMAQALIREQEKKSADLMLDLGNAFYPGLLSKFSHGSITMDYLGYFGFAATLVSSNDLNIGLGNLEFLTQNRRTILLSANIEKNGQTVFQPYFTSTIKGKKFAFIGITSPGGFLDVAEKQLFDANFANIHNVLTLTIDKLRVEQTDFIVVLSGLSYQENFDLMEKHKDISLCISGGDAEGQLFASKASRVDIESGRSLVTLTQPEAYYTLTMTAGEKLEVSTLKTTIPKAEKVAYTQSYNDFIKRLKLWKSQFASEGDQTLIENIPGQVPVNGRQTAELLRHRYGAEVVMLDQKAISSEDLSGRVTYSDILAIVNDDFPLFTYRITGKELKKAVADQKDLVTAGIEKDQVQGYPIDDKRDYLICSTQPVYDRIAKQSGREIGYKNTWNSISEVISSDLKTEQVIAKNDFEYLDRRIGMTIDLSLANFLDQSEVSNEGGDSAPPGKPKTSYTKWGIEDKIDFTIYNRYHKLVLTPYVYFISKDEDYLQNLLRGTLLYTYNMHPNIKPYQKSQVDTVVVAQNVENERRPMMFRETAGALFETRYLNGKLGLGFEKQTQDPAKDLFAGFEGLADSRIELWKDIIYIFNLDSFYGFKQDELDNHQFRAEISNALSFKLNSLLAISAKHKWFYFDSNEDSDPTNEDPGRSEKYTESQFLVSLDLKTDFKLF